MNTYNTIPLRLRNLAKIFDEQRHFTGVEADAIKNYLLGESDKVQILLDLVNTNNEVTPVPFKGKLKSDDLRFYKRTKPKLTLVD